MGEGRYRAAVKAYELAVRRQPEAPDRQRKLAAAYVADEQLPEAVRAYERAISLRTDYAKARTELAILLIRLDRHDCWLGAATAVRHSVIVPRARHRAVTWKGAERLSLPRNLLTEGPA